MTRPRFLAVFGALLAIGGTTVSAIDARRPLGLRDASFIAAVAGLFLFAVVMTVAGERAAPESLLNRYRRLVPWLVPGLAVLVMATMLVSRYGFRDCDDLAAPHRCSCYYIAWQQSARDKAPGDILARRRADVRAACPADDLPPEFKQ